MIRRLYLRELVAFEEVELEFSPGLVVFTGPSGAGKSLLISSILSSAGYKSIQAAALCEVVCHKPAGFNTESYEVEEDELTIKSLKKEKTRFYLNNQNISKKMLHSLFKPYVQYLSVRDKSGLDPESVRHTIDTVLLQNDASFKKRYKTYQKRFFHYQTKQKELAKIREDEAKLAELIEFTRFEIDKIEAVNPKPGEDETLMQVKKQLSHIDKLKASLEKASQIFNYEPDIEEVYRLLDKDISPFEEMMNQLRCDFEESETLAEELSEIDVEEVLDRLSDITALINRYGSIEEALAYKEMKRNELEGYQNIEQNKSMLESFLEMEFAELRILSQQLSETRVKAAKGLESVITAYLASLKLPEFHFIFSAQTMDATGMDRIDISLAHTSVEKLSGGEFNRLRLAMMASAIEGSPTRGVLILDEIDANVSGDESIAIAQMISKLSMHYQIFAISHQPHLSALANQHIVVKKEERGSDAVVLDQKGRIEEIARIISGETATNEAVSFAKKLLADRKN